MASARIHVYSDGGRIVRAGRGFATRGGFTFIEVLATLTVLAIVLPSIMSGISLCLSAADCSRQQAQASALCQSKLMELAATGQWQNGVLAGDCGTDWPAYQWTALVSQWDGTVVQQLDVTVQWTYRRTDRSVTLSTLVYSPSTVTGGTQ